MSRIGIFGGSFDPVHSGHISFALLAIQAAKLDKVYFMPERQPRGKSGITHYTHRLSMLRQALRPHPALDILDLPDRSFTTARTLPRLHARFPDDELLLLLGSDVLPGLINWPDLGMLLLRCGLIVGERQDDRLIDVAAELSALPPRLQGTFIVQSYHPTVSARAIREALMHRRSAPGLLASVRRYALQHWLYTSIGDVSERK